MGSSPDTPPGGLRSRLKRPVILAAFLLAALLAGLYLADRLILLKQSASSGAKRTNLLLITIDTLRADRLGCYGHLRAETPVIDGLAVAGVLFEQVQAAAPTTLPSHASILTGTYPVFHGVRNNGTYRLGDGATTLAEILRHHGYRTGAVVASYPLAARYGLDQGFEDYDDRLPAARPRQITYRERPAAEVTQAGVDWLETHAGDPFFLWLHYFDPHAPYAPPSPHAEEFAAEPYDGEIAYVDREIGRVLDALDRLNQREETIVALLSDHGEGLGEHGEATHGVFLYQSTLRIPLILTHPSSLPRGTRVGSPVRAIDLMPTILALLGLPTPEVVQGRDLQRSWSDLDDYSSASLSETLVPRENYGWSELASLRLGDWKYIEAPRPELYNLETDPGETENLAGSRPEELRRLRRDLKERLAASTQRGEAIGERQDLDEAARARLRSLGYIWSPGPSGTTRLPDPKDQIALLRDLDAARNHYAAGDFTTAIAIYDRILQADPGNATALFQRGNANLAASDHVEARRDFEALLAHRPHSTEVLQNLGQTLVALGDLDGAAERFEKVLELAPDSHAALIGLGLVLARRGEHADAAAMLSRARALNPTPSEAERTLAGLLEAAQGEGPEEAALREALAADPDDPDAAVGLARILYDSGRFKEMATILEGSLQAGAASPDVRFALGNAYFRMDRFDQAERQYSRVLEARPDHAGALFGLALTALKEGETDEAVQFLERSRSSDPENAAVRRNLAILYDESDRDAEAMAEYEAAIALDPNARELSFFLGRVYARAGRHAEARAAYEEYLAGGAGDFTDAARRELARLPGP